MLKNKFPRVNYGMTVHNHKEINAVLGVLKSSTQMGRNVFKFEDKVSKIFAKKYGIMTNSGSSAIYLALQALDFPKGSNIITPALTFGTCVSSIVQNNLVPNFVDVDRRTLCINTKQIEKKINKKTVAILAPDLIGNICDWKLIKKIAKKYQLKIIHDSADTLGAKLNDKPPSIYSDVSITSFYGSHIINGAGNGGMVLTSNKEIYNKIKLLRSWGRSSSIFADSESIENRFKISLDGIRYDNKFVFSELGYQMEPSEISAAFALEQLKKININTKKRILNFKKHIKFFSKYGEFFITPQQNPNSITAWLAFPILIQENKYFSRTELQIFLEKRNIQTRVIFTGNILRQPGFKNIKCIGKKDEFIESDYVMKNGMLLACHHGLTSTQLNHIHVSIKNFLKNKIYK